MPLCKIMDKIPTLQISQENSATSAYIFRWNAPTPIALIPLIALIALITLITLIPLIALCR